MEFNFETNIIETKGAVNTAAKIAEILKGAEVKFSTVKGTSTPGIWVKFPDSDKSIWVASRQTSRNADRFEVAQVYGDWWTVYPRDPRGNGQKEYLFDHTTDAAKELVKEWIMALCDEYDRRLDADTAEPELPENFV